MSLKLLWKIFLLGLLLPSLAAASPQPCSAPPAQQLAHRACWHPGADSLNRTVACSTFFLSGSALSVLPANVTAALGHLTQAVWLLHLAPPWVGPCLHALLQRDGVQQAPVLVSNAQQAASVTPRQAAESWPSRPAFPVPTGHVLRACTAPASAGVPAGAPQVTIRRVQPDPMWQHRSRGQGAGTSPCLAKVLSRIPQRLRLPSRQVPDSSEAGGCSWKAGRCSALQLARARLSSLVLSHVGSFSVCSQLP